MAAAKKSAKPVAVATPATEPKAEAKKVETPAAEVKTEVKAEVKEVKKETAKKETAKKATAKKETAKKASAKKETKTAATKTAAKKAAVKAEMQIQFAGKSYTQEDLVKIAQDVWQYDLNQKVSDLTSVELYVKPEEQAVYYVMNKEFTGSFAI